MNTQTHHLLHKRRFWQNLGAFDWVYALIVILMAAYVRLNLIHHEMNIYEHVIFWCCIPAIICLGWFFKPMRLFSVLSALMAYLATWLYQDEFSRAQSNGLLKYILSSQSAVMWLCTLTILAFLCYFVGALLMMRQSKKSKDNTFIYIGNILAWAATLFGLVALLVRWHESYLLRPDAGHIPVSNLYEVFILFIVIVGLMFLYYAGRNQLYRMGAFIYLLQTVLVAFVLWYSISRGAHEIQPLIPALESWWMKIHVPANFIGYGGFCLAAMLGVAQLLAIRQEVRQPEKTSRFLPASHILEEVMYKAIAIGFLFFTIATILGALWAADAWGRYWSWDPKETWALIVWLNYAIWLHMRLVAGWRGKILAWWAIAGLLITAFAFVGVNMFLSGLHSYGGL